MGFWAGRKVVVTGGAGMVGSVLCRQLQATGAAVHVLDDFSRGRQIVREAAYHRGDAGDVETCRRVFEGADAVFNLAAAVAGVLYNQDHHVEMFERNIRLLAAPVTAATLAHVPRFLQVSSVCVYSPDHNAPSREEYGRAGEPHPSNGGYAWAKRMGERLALWSGIPHVVVVRPSNIFGPGDYFDDKAHVIPALINKCLYESVITVHGTGEETREFLYVDDAAAGMAHALAHGKPGTVYNLGTNGETQISIKALVGLIRLATATEYKQITILGGNGGDPARWSDASRLRALGWRHRVELEEGIRRTVDWYLARRKAAAV